MNKLLAASLTILLIATSESQAVGFETGLDEVRDSGGSLVAIDTLILLVVDRDGDGFGVPEADASAVLNTYLVNDDFIAWRGDFSGGDAGVFFDQINFNIGSFDIPLDAPFAVYWFPTLTLDATAIPAGTSFGYYTSTDATQFGSDSAWNTGANNAANLTLRAYTAINTTILAPESPLAGGLANTALQATFTTVPEPATGALLGLGTALWLCSRRRRGLATHFQKNKP